MSNQGITMKPFWKLILYDIIIFFNKLPTCRFCKLIEVDTINVCQQGLMIMTPLPHE